MTILCIETSTQVCSAAVTIGGVPIAERVCCEGANHAQMLPVFVEELLVEVKAKGLRIEAVALSEGPGSYTGLRIGTSTAKGICYGLDVPLIPVQTLQVLCVAAASVQPVEGTNGYLCPMIDARRMEVYTAVYDGDLQEVSPVQAKVVEDGAWLPEGEVLYFGDGAAKCQEVLKEVDSARFIGGIVPEAKYMGVLAEQGKALSGKEIAYYEPYYLKEFVAAPSHVKGLETHPNPPYKSTPKIQDFSGTPQGRESKHR
ncbi:MAG: tRNA (adenosine(37)-N6)-threonylcarbamoyltransferase complex dimerization subunit type 1 TsaB [Paludibacteraceae bacterium]